MEGKRIIDHIKEETEKLKNEEYKFPETNECRNRIAGCWELFCQRAEEAKVNEDDMRELVSVLNFLTQRYYEALPKRDCSTEYPEIMTPEEARKSIDEMRYELELMKLMCVQSALFGGPFLDYGTEKISEMIEAIKEKAKHVSEEEMLQKIVDAQTKDPWIPEIGASLSSIRRFEELMGKYPEITEMLEKSKDKNNIYIVGEVNERREL